MKFMKKITTLFTFCALCLLAQNTFAQDYPISSGSVQNIQNLIKGDTITSQSTGGPICSVNVKYADNALFLCMFGDANSACYGQNTNVVIKVTSNAAANTCRYDFIVQDTPPAGYKMSMSFSSLGTETTLYNKTSPTTMMGFSINCPEANGWVRIQSTSGAAGSGEYGLSCVNAPACLPSTTPTKACATDPNVITACDNGCGGTIASCTVGICPPACTPSATPPASTCATNTAIITSCDDGCGGLIAGCTVGTCPPSCPAGQAVDPATNTCVTIDVFKTIFKDFVCLKNSAGVCVGSKTNFYYKEQ